MTRILIVRHGNTFAPGEEPRRVGAATDLPLVESGIAQAQALAVHLADRIGSVGRVLSSPLLRTRQTAEVIAKRTGAAPVTAVDWLREIDHGPDENRTEPEVIARIGANTLHDWDTKGIAPPDWTIDAPARLAAWRDFFADCETDTILVTSNGAARFALLARPDIAGQSSSLKLRTGAYGEMRRDPSGAIRILDWDRRPPAS